MSSDFKRNLNALIAEKIMGWENNEATPGGVDFPNMWGIMDYAADGSPIIAANFPDYSDDLTAAMEVVDELYRWNKMLHFNLLRTHDWAQGSGLKWGASFFAYMGMGEHEDFGKSIDESLPTAICQAAILTVKYIENKYGTSFTEMMEKKS